MRSGELIRALIIDLLPFFGAETAVAAIVLAVFALVAAVVALIRSMATARQANKYQHALGGAGGPANL